jgi:hypothetical protein
MFAGLLVYVVGFIITFIYMIHNNCSLKEIVLFSFGWPLIAIFILLLSCWFAINESWRF